MALHSSWSTNILKSRTQEDLQRANKTNTEIAEIALSKLLLARWSIFRLFIEEAKKQQRSLAGLKQEWLFFQLFSSSIYGDDPFNDFIEKCVARADLSLLLDLRVGLKPKDILGSEFNEHFFYVIDEIQVAGMKYRECFSDARGKEERPVLRPILQTLSSDSDYATIIVSGTGFSLSDFKTVFVSSVGKADDEWTTEYLTGDFTNPSIQSTYIERYLPASYLNSPSGSVLMRRMHKWLRGRYVIKSCQVKTHPILSIADTDLQQVSLRNSCWETGMILVRLLHTGY
jgi:hypothetical protein